MAIDLNRKQVEIAKKRFPLYKILNGEISDVLASIKSFRAQFAEAEVLYKAKVYLTYSQGEALATVRRLETDYEYNQRIARERKLEEEKAERKRIKEQRAQLRAEKAREALAAEVERKRLSDIQAIKALAKELRLTASDVFDWDD